MDLRQLGYFVAVAEEGSVTRAADRLHVTQPPLTAQIKRLEQELDVRLFVRHRRGVDLTDAGRELLGKARRILSDIAEVTESVRHIGDGRAGRLALSFDSETGWGVVPGLLARYRRERPHVVLDYAEELGTAVLDAVRLRRSEIGIVHLPPVEVDPDHEHRLDIAVIHREPLVAVLPRALAQQHDGRVDLADLAAEQFFAPTPGAWGGLYAHLTEACRLGGIDPAIRIVAQLATAVAMAGAGHGIALAPAAVRSLCGPAVVTLPLARYVPVVETAVVSRRGDALSPPADGFRRLAMSTPEPDVLGPELAPGRKRADDSWRWLQQR
ncbi:LysR substrate-binding domain-containing protein [Nocardia sp. CDC159]|uniref:LysR substrate-binding domain-containing protein n=1 Tax=Nocardia pulmonis TaxID=2951408 RepID=A0A9X2IZF6_9NOCA|nr:MULTISPECIES: LysR substrate-binding domain-containing protein [Nocardia]MCM6777443.1 LysR substrate-binding domain-containing protein [Nocardia pulmonis]MCM6790450.1 LysR substrate-binding domain-containing protein [Nocardia sp. CDC159]